MAALLEGKPWYFGLIIGVVVAVAIVWGTHYLLIADLDEQIRAAEVKIKELDTKIEQGRSAQRKLPQFREEVHRLELELEKLRRILPSTRNTEEIIKKIKSLVDQGDFVLHKLTFPKLAPAQAGDPYAEWPISVSVDGRYHNLAILFNRLSNFSRIINVEQINIGAMSVQTERTITSDFVAKTFVYIEPPPTPPGQATPGAPGAKPAAAGKAGGGT
jgi:type IV pilus assembly protein PilO